MALRLREAPEGVVDVVVERLSEIAARPNFPRALAQEDPEKVGLSVPHPVYTIGLDALRDGVGLDRAEPVSHRFLVMGEKDVVASAEVMSGGGFQSTEGPHVEGTAEAIRRAEESSELADGDYELRALRIPGLYLLALWLHNEGGGDVVIPVAPAPPPLEAQRNYSEKELLPVLADMARRILDAHADDEAVGG